MTWSRTKLERVAKGRLAKLGSLQPVEKAALAYARWQGLTDEDDVDTEAAKRALDKALAELDDMEPMEGWSGLTALAEDLGDEVIVGLMRYSVVRGAEQVKETAPQLDGETPDTPETGSPAKAKSKRRDRAR